jgi:hypothetical protein
MIAALARRRDDEDCFFEFARVLDTDVDSVLGLRGVKIGS